MGKPAAKSAPWEQAVLCTQMFHRFKFCFSIPCNKALTRQSFLLWNAGQTGTVTTSKLRTEAVPLVVYGDCENIQAVHHWFAFQWEIFYLRAQQLSLKNKTTKPNNQTRLPNPRMKKNQSSVSVCAVPCKTVWHLAWLCWDHSRGADLSQRKLEVLDGLLIVCSCKD